MNKIETCKLANYFPGATTATAATALAVFDTIGCSKAHFYVLSGSHTTTSHVWSDIDVYEGTNSSVATLIPAASFGTATSTAAANLLPTAALSGLSGGVVEINLDLSDKERYIGVKTTRGLTPGSAATGGVFAMFETETSSDNTTTKRGVDLGVNTHYQAVATVNA